MDQPAQTSQVFNVIEAIVKEFDRQGVAEEMASREFDVTALARVAIRAAEGAAVVTLRVPG